MSNYQQQIIETQEKLIKAYEEHTEHLNKVITLQDEIIKNYSEIVWDDTKFKEKINHLKLVIDNSKSN